jgi:signal peptide peptidase SppA
MPRETKELKLSPERMERLDRIANAPMAMKPEALRVLAARIVSMGIFEEPPSLEATIIEKPPVAAKMPKLPKVKGAVAVIPIYGAIGQHRGGDYWGGCFSKELCEKMGQMMDMPNVGAVVLSIDSPGGIVYGIPESAKMMREMREMKPIYGHILGEGASAAYWLGSQTTKLFAGPSSKAGSIGVWTMHINAEKFYEEMGLDITLISAGKYKTEGHPFGPLDDEGKKHLQESVDQYYDAFLVDVAMGRNVTKAVAKSDFGEGRMVDSESAKAAGMIDGICSMDELLAGMMPPPPDKEHKRNMSAAIAIAEAWSPSVDA